MENVTISFKHEYRRPNLTSGCDVMGDVNSVNIIFSMRICDYLSYLMSNQVYIEKFEIVKFDEILMSQTTFLWEVLPEVEYVTSLAKRIPSFLYF